MKMCDFCNFDSDGETPLNISNRMIDGGVFGYIHMKTLLTADNETGKNARLLIYVGNAFDDIIAKYCPMCGRKLESEETEC